jgi:RNA polymerase sigma-70 factor (ECF subfamily)
VAITDEERFAALFRAYQPAVMRYALRRVDVVDADDLVAQTFLTVWRKLDQVPKDPLPWLYGVTRHTMLDGFRERERQGRLHGRLSAVADLVAPGVDSDAALDVRRALAQLKESDQELLRLSAWEDLAPAEIARVVGCSAATAAVRLHRARRRLAAALASPRPGRSLPLDTGARS